jgi:hypothetical protein
MKYHDFVVELDFKSGKAPEAGAIGLQLHGGRDMHIEIRKLKISER